MVIESSSCRRISKTRKPHCKSILCHRMKNGVDHIFCSRKVLSSCMYHVGRLRSPFRFDSQ